MHMPSITSKSKPAAFDSIVGIIVAGDGSDQRAMTTASFAEAAHHPCSVWVAIDKHSAVHASIKQSGKFSLCILHSGQEELAKRCNAFDGRLINSDASIKCFTVANSFSFLEDSLACSACLVRESVDLGDLSLFIADICDCQVDNRYTHRPQLLASEVGLI
jgi:flavin reductase (DIM6/NTAB) family NADH-FMN oxidoreductase RutF